MATVIVVNGMPGVGKTTLLKRLSHDLGIGYIAKDSIKELLGNTLFVPSEDIDSYYYGDASVSALYAVVASFLPSEKILFVENAFWHDLATERFQELSKTHESLFLQIYVTCDYMETRRRFEQRVGKGERHFIHPDTVHDSHDEESSKIKYRALEIEGMKTFMMDTTESSEDSYQMLVQWIKQETGGTT